MEAFLSIATANYVSTGGGQGIAPGDVLRAARKRLGLTRAQLAALADCGVTSLGWIEQGAVPKHSAVLGRAWAAIHALEAERQ